MPFCTKCGAELEVLKVPTGKYSSFSGKPTYYTKYKCPKIVNEWLNVGHDNYYDRVYDFNGRKTERVDFNE